jgi:hypothetical protein
LFKPQISLIMNKLDNKWKNGKRQRNLFENWTRKKNMNMMIEKSNSISERLTIESKKGCQNNFQFLDFLNLRIWIFSHEEML